MKSSHPVAALRVSWRDALELDPTRAHNQLCLINDFRGVPDAPDLGNVAWLEMEDRWTDTCAPCWYPYVLDNESHIRAQEASSALFRCQPKPLGQSLCVVAGACRELCTVIELSRRFLPDRSNWPLRYASSYGRGFPVQSDSAAASFHLHCGECEGRPGGPPGLWRRKQNSSLLPLII